MENEFVTYEQALALKELGLDEECFAYFDYYGRKVELLLKDSEWDGYGCDAPLKQQVFRWFRSKKMLSEIVAIDSWDEFGYIIVMEDCVSPFFICADSGSIQYNTYEEAENACIDKLIEIAKQQDNGK